MKEVPTYDFDVPRALARAEIFGEDVEKMGKYKIDYDRISLAEDHLLNAAFQQWTIILDPRMLFLNDHSFC